MNLEVAIAAALIVSDLPPYALREDLGAASRQRVEPRVHQLAQNLLVGLAIEIGEERNLHRGEALEMDVGADPLEAAQQLRVVVEREIRVQTVDDVNHGEWLVGALPQLVPRLVERHGVRAVVARLQAGTGAEVTARHTDVRRFEANVVV